ncbi:MAG: 2-hydroxyacyl-CoA dehydratase [Acutalibacteraceae bacterium]|nr:2-hydroxyacyl-CoA dehydratase [Acutalibacteraceae bacterium]
MATLKYDKTGRLLFTKEMKKEYKILIPQMASIQFRIMKRVFDEYGYNTELLETDGPEIAQVGLKYVHNDTCYPALLVIGQFIHALQSGKYDVHKTALLITQTGGGCRASNYIHLLRKALKKAGLEFVPVISLNISGLESNPGFTLTLPIARKLIGALVYGDTLMLLSNQTKPYEVNKGESMALVDSWIENIIGQYKEGRGFKLEQQRQNLDDIAKSFSNIERNIVPKVKVGVVGEIYVKYAPLGNNNLEAFLNEQGCEVCVPGIMAFALFKLDNRLQDIQLYGGNKIKYNVLFKAYKYLEKMENLIIECAVNNGFTPPGKYSHLKHLVDGVIGLGNKMGEGWLLTSEMLELAESGYPNIVCTQPFGCLPNHICGKGMVRRVKEINPKANIVAIDYDPGASRVNQENRIKLMLSVAKENLQAELENNSSSTVKAKVKAVSKEKVKK